MNPRTKMKPQANKEQTELIRNYLIEQPLYRDIQRESENDLVVLLENHWFKFDAYCKSDSCQKSSIFRSASVSELFTAPPSLASGIVGASAKQASSPYFDTSIQCLRCGSIYKFFNLFDDECIAKVGQFPALEDIASGEIRKFRKLLSEEDYSAIHRATGLASHGVGIGSYVYLRRVFEHLIDKRHQARTQPIKQFSRMKMHQKIEALGSSLPPSISEHSNVYSILSLGVHQLSEEECLKYFSILRASIIQILSEDYEAKQSTEARKKLEIELQKISAEVKLKS